LYSVSEMERLLSREFDTDVLHVRWDEEAHRYVISQKIRKGALCLDQDIMCVANPDGSYRPLDARVVRDLRNQDKKLLGNISADTWVRKYKNAQEARFEKRFENIRYKAREHRRQFAKWADENL
jgi:hypothetical protein